MSRIAFNIALLTVFAVVAFYAVGTLVGRDCETELCCRDCGVISVSRIIDGDTFESAGRRIRLYGVDTPERGQACSPRRLNGFVALLGRASGWSLDPGHATSSVDICTMSIPNTAKAWTNG